MSTASLVSLIALVVVSVATAASSVVQGFWLDHTTLAVIVLPMWNAIAHFLPAPALGAAKVSDGK